MPIERLSPALDDIIDSDSVAMIDSQDFSFGGADGPAEGPLWWVCTASTILAGCVNRFCRFDSFSDC